MPDNLKFGKRLVQTGIITQEQLDFALKHPELEEGRLGELLVKLRYVSESNILQSLAAEFRTRYVSTERLAKAKIQQTVLDFVPLEYAERYRLIPVLYDTDSKTLSVVTSEPQNDQDLREVHNMTTVKILRVYVALLPAVQASIRKHYRGEINAFKDLLHQDGLELASDASRAPLESQSGYISPAPDYNQQAFHHQQIQTLGNYGQGTGPNFYNAPATPSPYETPSPYGQPGSYPGSPLGGYAYSGNYNPGIPHNPNYPYNLDPAYNTSYGEAYSENYDEDKTQLGHPYPNAGMYAPNTLQPIGQMPLSAQAVSHFPNASAMSQIPLGASIAQREISPFAQMNIIELVRHLMQQVEQKHPRYYNHLEQQRTVLQAMLRRLNFSAAESQSLWLAFYLHHISLPEPHYCLLNLYEGEELQKKCQSQFKSDIALFERFVLPQETMQILFYLYERFDGEGFPEGIKQNDIPIGSRVLAILDSYEELLYTMPTITSEQINQKLCEHSDSLFDKRLLDIFFEELKRIERHTKGTLPKILLFDRDQDLIDELERMLWERGFWVQTTNNMTQAEYLCQRENFDLIVLDIDLGENEDGFAWIEQIRINCNSVPEFVILTHQDQQEKLDRGMALARDYLIKPTNTNLSLVLAKLSKHIEQLENEKKKLKLPAKAIHGLTGSLDQLGLPEILQVLSQSRRSGQLTIESKEHKGLIYLQDGEVFNASMGEFTGEAAFGKMMSWHQGEFNFNPNIPTGERLIHKRLDGLILDTLRILDESVRDGIEDPFDSFDLSFEPEQPEDKTAAKEHEAFFDLSLDDEDMPFSIQLLEDEDSTDKKQKDDSIPPPPFPPKIQ